MRAISILALLALSACGPSPEFLAYQAEKKAREEKHCAERGLELREVQWTVSTGSGKTQGTITRTHNICIDPQTGAFFEFRGEPMPEFQQVVDRKREENNWKKGFCPTWNEATKRYDQVRC